MSESVVAIEPQTDAMEALRRIQENDIGRLPVVEDGELVGIVSRTDLMKALEIIRARGTSDLEDTPLVEEDDRTVDYRLP